MAEPKTLTYVTEATFKEAIEEIKELISQSERSRGPVHEPVYPERSGRRYGRREGDHFLSLPQLSKELGVDKRTVLSMLSNLPYTQLGTQKKWRRSEIDKFLERNTNYRK